MTDMEQFPYAQDLDGIWHWRPEGDEWHTSIDEPQCRTACGLNIHSVHVSEGRPDGEFCQACREHVMRDLAAAQRTEWSAATPTAQRVVVLREQGTVFGPFGDHGEAARFAAYLTEEVDPAEVRLLCSPALDLLNWRDMVAQTKERTR